MREILLMVMPLGQTASHSPILEQLPKPSSSILVTMRRVRLSRSGWPWGSLAYWVSLALVNSEAEEFGQAATHAPQPMQVADKKAASDSGLPIRMALASACGPVVTEVYPPTWMMRSSALRSVTRSLMIGKARARNGSMVMVSPSEKLRI